VFVVYVLVVFVMHLAYIIAGFAAHALAGFAADVGPAEGLGPEGCLGPGDIGDIGASFTNGVRRGCLSSVRIASSENIVLSTCENNLSGYLMSRDWRRTIREAHSCIIRCQRGDKFNRY
jgi:hypothetical protein